MLKTDPFFSRLIRITYSNFSNESRIFNPYNGHIPLSIILGFYLVIFFLF